jgi:peptidyl-prolyl cis-trans isomerase C
MRSQLLFRFALAMIMSMLASAAHSAAVDDQTVIVSRGNSVVTVADLRARMTEVAAEDRVEFISDRGRLDSTLRQLLEMKQLADAGRAAGVDRSPEYLAAIRLGSERALAAVYNQKLRADALSKADLEQLARERFLANPAPPGVNLEVRHILVKIFEDREEALRKASDLLDRVRAGESIEALAVRYSDDVGSRNSGGLISGPSESFDPSFSAAAIALELPGDLAPVTESSFGFHVIQLVSKTKGQQATFESHRDRLITEVEEAVVRRYVTDFHERLFAPIPELNEPVIDRLLAEPASLLETQQGSD